MGAAFGTVLLVMGYVLLVGALIQLGAAGLALVTGVALVWFGNKLRQR